MEVGNTRTGWPAWPKLSSSISRPREGLQPCEYWRPIADLAVYPGRTVLASPMSAGVVASSTLRGLRPRLWRQVPAIGNGRAFGAVDLLTIDDLFDEISGPK